MAYLPSRRILLSVVLLLIVSMSQSMPDKTFKIVELKRKVTLNGNYPSEQSEINFFSLLDSQSHFYYVIPEEYNKKVAKIGFMKNLKDKEYLPYEKSSFIFDGVNYASYKINLGFNHNVGDHGSLVVAIVYINRYTNLPEKITMNEDQKLQYEDNKFVVSPYEIQKQSTLYKFTKVIQYDTDGVKKSLSEVEFKKTETQPYTVENHIIFGVNNNPQVVLTSVEKIIQVSHWGNVAISQSYKLKNTGPGLKGQFSRVTYGSRNQADAKNAFRGIEFDLPFEVWGLYYHDQVGNISSSKAYRDHSNRIVRVGLTPRFALMGGWKCNWQVGYNFKTDGHLFHNGNNFSLKNVKLAYALEKLLSEQYTLKVVLPEGSTNVQLKIGDEFYEMSNVQTETSQGYLDFNGRPTYVINNYQGILKDKNLEVIYDYNVMEVYRKPISLAVIIFGILAISIFASRFELQSFSDKSKSA